MERFLLHWEISSRLGHLSLHNDRLNGSIPLELENRTNLRHQSLSRNNLTEFIYEKLTKVPNNDLSWYGRAACGTAITVASDP